MASTSFLPIGPCDDSSHHQHILCVTSDNVIHKSCQSGPWHQGNANLSAFFQLRVVLEDCVIQFKDPCGEGLFQTPQLSIPDDAHHRRNAVEAYNFNVWSRFIRHGQLQRAVNTGNYRARCSRDDGSKNEGACCPFFAKFSEFCRLQIDLTPRKPEGKRSSGQCHDASSDAAPKAKPIRCFVGGDNGLDQRPVGAHRDDHRDARQHDGKGPNLARSVHPPTFPPRPPVVERYLHA